MKKSILALALLTASSFSTVDASENITLGAGVSLHGGSLSATVNNIYISVDPSKYTHDGYDIKSNAWFVGYVFNVNKFDFIPLLGMAQNTIEGSYNHNGKSISMRGESKDFMTGVAMRYTFSKHLAGEFKYTHSLGNDYETYGYSNDTSPDKRIIRITDSVGGDYSHNVTLSVVYKF